MLGHLISQRCQWISPRHATGLSFVFITSIIWVAASFLVQNIDSELGAFPLTYIANSLFVLYLPIFGICLRIQQKRAATGRYLETLQNPDVQPPDVPGDVEERQSLVQPPPHMSIPSPTKYDGRTTFRAACVVAPLWFAAQYTFNQSLSMTSVSSNTILSSASSMFTFLGSVFFLGEKYTTPKLISVLLCMAGTACVGLADQHSESSSSWSVWGDLMSLASSIFYAAYTLAIKHHLPDDEALGMSQFFGFMGLVIMLGMAPVLLVLQMAGTFDLGSVPSSIYMLTLVKGIFDNVLTDYLWARAVVLVGPTLATIGLSVQVPMAIVADVFFQRSVVFDSAYTAVMNFFGATLILLGFLGITVSELPGLGALVGKWIGRSGDGRRQC